MYVRRYRDGVSNTTIRETAQVAVIDRRAASSGLGVTRGYPLVVGRVTNDGGEPLAPRMIMSEAELRQIFGAASPYIGTATDGYDGNVHAQIAGLGSDKRRGFPCIIVPVDSEAGEVTFSRPSPGTASVVGTAGPWALTPGMTLIVSVDGGAPQTATFDAARAHVTGAAATYAACVGGHTLVVRIDGGSNQTVTCAGTENSQALWHNLLNGALIGAHVVNQAGQTRIYSDTYGTASIVQVVSGDADVLAALGLSAATGTGTGDVADISAVTAAEF